MTLHVRVVSPPETTEALIAKIAKSEGVSHIMVVRDGHQPSGDAVQFDVEQPAANSVLNQLRALNIHRDSTIAIHGVDASIKGTPPQRSRLVARDFPPVWDLVESRIRTDATYAPSFYLLLVIAGLIASTGILANSQILIVGAMVVGPEYGAIMGVALGIDKHERSLINTGLLAMFWGFLSAIVASFVFGLCIRALGKTPHLFELGIRPVSSLINAPNLFSVVIAVLAGIVGIVSLTEARAGAIIGVFISVTTIPAAADTGLSSAYALWHEAGGSLVQLLVNVVLLIAVGAGGLRLQRLFWRRRGDRQVRLSEGLGNGQPQSVAPSPGTGSLSGTRHRAKRDHCVARLCCRNPSMSARHQLAVPADQEQDVVSGRKPAVVPSGHNALTGSVSSGEIGPVQAFCEQYVIGSDRLVHRHARWSRSEVAHRAVHAARQNDRCQLVKVVLIGQQ
jgi:uncharacterized hydrophobic protein (TIGR00271 family)